MRESADSMQYSDLGITLTNIQILINDIFLSLTSVASTAHYVQIEGKMMYYFTNTEKCIFAEVIMKGQKLAFHAYEEGADKPFME